MKEVQIEEMIGAKILSVLIPNEHYNDVDKLLSIKTNKGIFHFVHVQDCCENVSLEDGFDDLKKIIGKEIIEAECVTNSKEESDYYESHTWTFYKLKTFHTDVCLRFLGESNGYYSEEVDILMED